MFQCSQESSQFVLFKTSGTCTSALSPPVCQRSLSWDFLWLSWALCVFKNFFGHHKIHTVQRRKFWRCRTSKKIPVPFKGNRNGKAKGDINFSYSKCLCCCSPFKQNHVRLQKIYIGSRFENKWRRNCIPFSKISYINHDVKTLAQLGYTTRIIFRSFRMRHFVSSMCVI